MASMPDSPSASSTPRMAVDCLWLKRTLDTSTPDDPFLMLCTHIVRDGRDCIGPFLENLETDCQLWEPNQRLAARSTGPDESTARSANAAG